MTLVYYIEDLCTLIDRRNPLAKLLRNHVA